MIIPGRPGTRPPAVFMSRTRNTEIAPDGSSVELLQRSPLASQCLCTLPAGCISKAVRHRSVEELWYVVTGTGDLWLEGKGNIPLTAGASVRIEAGQGFQFRADADETLRIHITTLPPWPGDTEAESATGPWQANLEGAP